MPPTKLSFLPILRRACFASTRKLCNRSDQTTHFGFQTVGSNEKAKLVEEVFSKVASRYDLMNDVMSAGLHRVWKDQLVSTLGPIRGTTIVDLAGGTGDVTFRIVEALKRSPNGSPSSPQITSHTKLFVCDINADMLAEGRRRAEQLEGVDKSISIEFVQGDAEALPFPDGSVDAVTIAFGLRNVTRTLVALTEARRVLRREGLVKGKGGTGRGGRFLCMEFSLVRQPQLRGMYDAYSFAIIPLLGRLITGDAQPYEYLVESIRRFPDQEGLASLMAQAGMEDIKVDDILDGLVSIHSGYRL